MFQKKSLGQNFLKSKKVIADIVLAGKILVGETVLEAGPGEGILTEALLAAGAKVVAEEKDQRLIPMLQHKFSGEIASGQLTLTEGDILNFNPSSFSLEANSWKLIANIPYYITGAFIRKFLESENQPSVMVILVQKEVAQRIVARDKKESILSVSVKAYGTPRYIQTVKAGSFSPAPNVDSAILAIENISKKFFNGFTEEKFFGVVKTGFAHKRKKLAGNLGVTDAFLVECAIPKNARAENLSLEQWRQLTTFLKK
ncbi:MAG: 16S rRNA (adenine(1518)-N(6)/adenine(1519)-N(6))-dimethyltransferase RsmA [bacterium]|nr:16S rRNA (adenine(1518)-N(6)/adenine(1519)-N(6))-dimethyltransferase RsmA [bacterium]